MVRWVLIVLLFASLFLPNEGLNPILALVVGELAVIIALLHFASWTRWSTALQGLVIIYVVAYASEFLGTHTGLVFGNYFYSPTAIGPLVGEVPILLPLAYFGMGYGAYVVTRVILRNTGRRLNALHTVLTSLLAAFIMTAIDVVSDPIGSTLLGKWTWEDGGPYFGVPVHNFYGWLATTFTFFVLVTVLLNRPANVALRSRQRSVGFWWQGILVYASYGVVVFLNPFLGRTGEIYDAMGMLAVFIMAIPTLAAGLNLSGTPENGGNLAVSEKISP